MTPGPLPRPSQSGRLIPPTDLRSRAHARLAERVDLSRSRHKPLSLLRAEAKRVLDQFYDTECLTLTRSERDRLVDDTIAAAVGFSPLEELFRDAAVGEILVLGGGQALTRKGDAWLPANPRFRDAAQLRAALGWLAELGEPVVPGGNPLGGLDVRLPNGFRLIAVLPPEVLEQPPLALFVRGAGPAPGAGGSGVIAGAVAPPGGPGSGFYPAPGSGVFPRSVPPATALPPLPPRPTPTVTGPPSGVRPDPFAGVRKKVTERLIASLSAAGVYDLSRIPPAEMRKIVAAYVHEQVAFDRLGLDADAEERLAIEILTGMNL